jgi:hypothetical protein
VVKGSVRVSSILASKYLIRVEVETVETLELIKITINYAIKCLQSGGWACNIQIRNIQKRSRFCRKLVFFAIVNHFHWLGQTH